MTADMKRFSQQVLTVVLIVLLTVAVAYSIEILLLVFAGILVGILFRSAGTWLNQRIGMNRKKLPPLDVYASSLERMTASAISRMERRVFMLCC
jgi:hypothetical protein